MRFSKSLTAGAAVFIEWEDSYGCSSDWQNLPVGGTSETMICRSVGWILRRSRRNVTIVPHMAQNERLGVDQGCGDMVIPLAAIVRVVQLNGIGERKIISSSSDA